VRLCNSQDVSLIQRMLIILVLRLMKKRRFQFRLVNRLFRVLLGCMGKSLPLIGRTFSRQEVQQNATTKLAHVHEQSEFTYGVYLDAQGTFKAYSSQ